MGEWKCSGHTTQSPFSLFFTLRGKGGLQVLTFSVETLALKEPIYTKAGGFCSFLRSKAGPPTVVAVGICRVSESCRCEVPCERAPLRLCAAPSFGGVIHDGRSISLLLLLLLPPPPHFSFFLSFFILSSIFSSSSFLSLSFLLHRFAAAPPPSVDVDKTEDCNKDPRSIPALLCCRLTVFALARPDQ